MQPALNIQRQSPERLEVYTYERQTAKSNKSLPPNLRLLLLTI